MNAKELLDLAIRGIASPNALWTDKIEDKRDWTEVLKSPVALFISIIAILSSAMIMIFGYRVPFVGSFKLPMSDVVLQAVGAVILYIIPIVIMSYVAVYLANDSEVDNKQSRALWMLFLVSIPSLIGRLLVVLPTVGILLAIALGVYSIVLFYKSIPVFMGVSLDKRLRYFILMAFASIVVSVALSFTIGRAFQPSTPTLKSIEMATPSAKFLE